jgi:hypothetical protein
MGLGPVIPAPYDIVAGEPHARDRCARRSRHPAGVHALVVEDDQDAREILKLVLEFATAVSGRRSSASPSWTSTRAGAD